jgi:thiamine biosynthesis lipoprotein
MKKSDIVEKEFKALGTDIYLQLVCSSNSKKRASKDLSVVADFYLATENIFSRFKKDSELNFFNQNLGNFFKASPHFLLVAKEILRYHALSKGMFDPRVIEVLEWVGYKEDFKKNQPLPAAGKSFPKINIKNLKKDLVIRGKEVLFNHRMDFAGITKGHITDTAGEMLKSFGWENFLIDSGGDMCAFGKDQKQESWKVDIEGITEEKILLTLNNEAIATSGIGRRKWESKGKKFHHLINPKNPEKFSFDLKSVTVISPTAIEADFWAKVLFLLGKEDGREFSLNNKIKSIFLDYRGDAFLSLEMKKNHNQ